MIRSFRHKGLERFFETGSKAGINPAHAARLRLQLFALDAASTVDDLPRSWRPHRLAGSSDASSLAGHYSIWVNGNWRLTFVFDGPDVHLLDYLDYH